MKPKSRHMSEYTEDWWMRFLEDYVTTINARIAELSDSPMSQLSANFLPATADEILTTEERLGVKFSPAIRNFYFVSNGWPADGWQTPPVCSLSELNFLEHCDHHLFKLADDVENATEPFPNDPGGSRLNEYRLDCGTRVKRSLSICANSNDSYTVLVDPFFGAGEWPCGQWAHWIPGMSWSADSFAQYMMMRLRSVLMLLQDE